MTLNKTHRMEQFSHTFQCIILALHGNKHRISCSQRVKRQNAKRRRTVYQNEIELAHYGFQRFCQFLFAPNHRSHLYLCTRQADVGRQQAKLTEQVDVYNTQKIEYANFADEHFVDGSMQAIGGGTATAGGICLRINVYEQRFVTLRSETRSLRHFSVVHTTSRLAVRTAGAPSALSTAAASARRA